MPVGLWGSRGEKRVKEILNYKKPTFWVVLAAVVVCVIVAVCFLTNPKQGTTTTILLTNEAGKSETVWMPGMSQAQTKSMHNRRRTPHCRRHWINRENRQRR